MQTCLTLYLLTVWLYSSSLFLATCWSHQCGAEVWLTSLSLSFTRYKCMHALTQPYAILSSQTRSGIGVSVHTHLRFSHRHRMKNLNTTLPSINYTTISAADIIFQLMLLKQLAPQPAGLLTVQRRSSIRELRALKNKLGFFICFLCHLDYRNQDSWGETSLMLFLKGGSPSRPLVLDDTSNCSLDAGESV